MPNKSVAAADQGERFAVLWRSFQINAMSEGLGPGSEAWLRELQRTVVATLAGQPTAKAERWARELYARVQEGREKCSSSAKVSAT